MLNKLKNIKTTNNLTYEEQIKEWNNAHNYNTNNDKTNKKSNKLDKINFQSKEEEMINKLKNINNTYQNEKSYKDQIKEQNEKNGNKRFKQIFSRNIDS